MDIFKHTIVCMAAVALCMGSRLVNIGEFVSDTRSEDSLTQCLSSLKMFANIAFVFLVFVFICRKILIERFLAEVDIFTSV